MTHAIVRTSLALALTTVLAACGSRTVPGSSSGTQTAPPDAGVVAKKPPPLLKVSVIELQIEGSQIWISITNEVGATDLVDVGKYEGACTDDVDTTGDPDNIKDAVFAVDCRKGDGVVRLRFLHRAANLQLVRAKVGSDDFEMFRTFELPRDSRLTFQK